MISLLVVVWTDHGQTVAASSHYRFHLEAYLIYLIFKSEFKWGQIAALYLLMEPVPHTAAIMPDTSAICTFNMSISAIGQSNTYGLDLA